MSRALKLLTFIYFVVFLTTGAFMVLIVNADEGSAPWIALFNMGKGLESVQVERLVLCILTSPFVFYPTYNLWLSSSSQSYILFEVIIFQGGFFWQALLTKAKPMEQGMNIPWSVNNGAGRNATAKPVTAQSGGPELGR